MVTKMKRKITLSTTQIIMISFLATILVGSILLALPISSADGIAVPYLDALFTATTCTCVTGLVTVPTFSTWSLFGQIVILLLIQIGGLGVITIMTGLMMLFNRKLGIGDHMLIQDAFNLNTMTGLSKFIVSVLCGTYFVEVIGALLYMLVLVPEFGAKGIWMSIFNSVSAFCNAGMDIIGENSLINYATNPLINFVTSVLIILGGIGYIVWLDVIRLLKNKKRKKQFRYLTLQSKIAISATLGLILMGAALIFLMEYSNPLTIGNLSLFDKIQVSLFQSITTRTAGFVSVPQENLKDTTSLICILLMMIGGSPVGTAGGIKTVTIVVLVCSAFATIQNRDNASVFHRSISLDAIRKAVAVVVMFITICLVSIVLLMSVSNASALDVIYEVVSATATVGLSRNFTSSLNEIGKIIIIVTMYLGRIGPISLAIAFGSKNENQNIITEPTEEISIG